MAKLPDGKKLCSIQITQNPKFPVFLPLYDHKNGEFIQKNIDEATGEIILNADFCERLGEMAEKEETSDPSTGNEFKELGDIFEKLKTEMNEALDKAKVSFEKKLLDVGQ